MEIYLYVISALSIILGFIALLKQRTYIDADTKQPTEVEVPVLGKLKSNYPALVFVFLGFAASIFAFDRADRLRRHTQELADNLRRDSLNRNLGTDTWTITGDFDMIKEDPNCTGRKINFENSRIVLDPTDIVMGPEFEPEGYFEFKINVAKGKSFENAISTMYFTLESGGVFKLIPKNEFDLFNHGKQSKLHDTADHGRDYKILINCF
jgi:hypothetical protein